MNEEKRISELQRERVLKRWEKNNKKELNKRTIDKEERRKLFSLLIGYLQGDGCLSTWTESKQNKTHHEISFYPDHIELARIFADSYEKLYGRFPKIKQLKNYYSVRTNHHLAFFDLMKIAKFDSLNWRIPLNLLDNEEKKKNWLKAFFDCEGYVSDRSIVIQSINGIGLKQIQKLLLELKIESKIYIYERKQENWKTNHLLFINKKESRERFLKEIGFNHPSKQEKLEKMFASIA